MIEGIDFEALLADKALDIDWIRAELDSQGAMAVIPPKANRVRSIACDFAMYKWRHLVENFFCDLIIKSKGSAGRKVRPTIGSENSI